MSKFITSWNTTAEYDAVKDSLATPQVALTKDNNTVHYKPIDPYVGHDYVDLGLPSGTKWATMNVGATGVTDYGLYFQWGDVSGYTTSQVGTDKVFNWENYKYSNNGGSTADDMTKYNATDGLVTLEASDDAAVANMGGSWRMPTETDFNELLNTSNCTKVWKSKYNGTNINGYLFTSKSNGNTLFFPAAGYCYDGSVYSVRTIGLYWSSSIYTSNKIKGRYLQFYNGGCEETDSYRSYGYPVRGVVGQ